MERDIRTWDSNQHVPVFPTFPHAQPSSTTGRPPCQRVDAFSEMKDFTTLQIQCNDSHRTFMWKYLTNLNVTWRAIIFVGVLFCVCYFSYFKAISHVVLISSAFAFCVQIVYWSSCFYWLHTRSKWQQENFVFLLLEQCCLVGLSLSLFIMLVTCFLLPVRWKKKINRVGLMIANCN